MRLIGGGGEGGQYLPAAGLAFPRHLIDVRHAHVQRDACQHQRGQRRKKWRSLEAESAECRGVRGGERGAAQSGGTECIGGVGAGTLAVREQRARGGVDE